MKKTMFLLAALTMWSASAQNVMTPETLWKLGRVSLEDANRDGAVYGVTRYQIDANSGERDLYYVDLETQEVQQLTDFKGSESEAFFLRNGDLLGFLHKGQVYVRNMTTGEITQVSDIEGGVHSIKTRELKDGRVIMAFVTTETLDVTPADRYPNLPQAEFDVYDDLMIRHWASWNDHSYNHVAYTIIDPHGKRTTKSTDIMKGERHHAPMPPFGGSESFDISPDGRYIAYASKKVGYGQAFATSTNSAIYLYDRNTGKTVQLQGREGYDNHPSFSPNGAWLAFTAMAENGYESDMNQLYVVPVQGAEDLGELEPLIPNEYVGHFEWRNNQSIVFGVDHMATKQILRVDFLRGKRGAVARRTVELTSGDYNYGHFVVAGNTVVAQRQDMNHANELFKLSAVKEVAPVAITHVNDDIYNNIGLSKIEKRFIPTSDGGSMLTWVIYPPDFDPNKRYPTLLYCQGGPQSAVSQFYSFRWNFQLMAAQGYIVVAPNRHGVPGFGHQWNEQISGDWGGQAMRDYLAAIDHVAKEPFVDANNLGAVGASYGGYSVYMLAGIHENRFKALISHCGLFDMKSWYLTTEELFFANKDIEGPFWGDDMPKSYTEYNPINYVDRWTAPILVIHGGRDYRVPFNQGLEAYTAAKLRGVPARFLHFPNEGHWVLSPQNGLVWHSEFFGWLDKWLK